MPATFAIQAQALLLGYFAGEFSKDSSLQSHFVERRGKTLYARLGSLKANVKTTANAFFPLLCLSETAKVCGLYDARVPGQGGDEEEPVPPALPPSHGRHPPVRASSLQLGYEGKVLAPILRGAPSSVHESVTLLAQPRCWTASSPSSLSFTVYRWS